MNKTKTELREEIRAWKTYNKYKTRTLRRMTNKITQLEDDNKRQSEQIGHLLNNTIDKKTYLECAYKYIDLECSNKNLTIVLEKYESVIRHLYLSFYNNGDWDDINDILNNPHWSSQEIIEILKERKSLQEKST